MTALSLDGDSPRSATTSITRGGGGTTTGDDPPPEDDENTVVEPAAALTPSAPGPPTSLPARPTGLSAQPSHDRVLLTWDDPGDDSISGYRILRRMRHLQAPGVFSVLLADSGSAAASYSDTDVVPETDYVYRVKAINADGLSTQSSFANALTPAAPPATSTASPQHLTAALLNGAITISWNPPTEDADAVTGYQILRRTPESGIPTLRQFQILVDNTASTDTSYTDRTATFDRLLYIYRIKALRAEQLSDWSNAAQYRARFGTLQPYDAVRPPPPTGLRASDDDGAVQLNWDPAPIVSPLLAEAATSYRIWREPLDQPILSWGGPATYRNISQASFRDSAVEAGGRYRYGVSVEQPHLKHSLASEPVIIEIPAPLSDDASLSSLALAAHSLSPAFAAELTSYTADLDADVETITLSAAATHSAATVAITPVDADTNAEGHQLSLAVGDNSVTVTVTAEDGASTRTYTLTLTRAAPPSDDASLSSLDVVDSDDGVALLTPAFDPATLSYATQVGADIEQVSVTATPADDGATVQIAPADADPDSDGHQVDVAEGAPAAVTVTVTAEDGATTRVYALSVLRDAQTPAAAASAGLDAAPGWTFDPATKRYHVAQSPAATAGRLRMTPASGSELDAFTVDAALRTRQIGTGGTTRLSSSADTILFIRAASGQRETLYSVRLRPPASASTSADQRLATKGGGWTATSRSNHNPTLSALTVSPGALDPAFAAATHAYTVEVAHDVEQLTITPTAAGSANATVTGNDANTDTPGHQVALNAADPGGDPAETIIAIVVSDGTNVASYAITAKRAAPPLTVATSSSARCLYVKGSDASSSSEWSGVLDSRNSQPWGVWSNGVTVWVSDSGDCVFAYTVASVARDVSKDLDLRDGSTAYDRMGRGVWSDGTTMWVARDSGDHLAAYLVESGLRSSADSMYFLAYRGYGPSGNMDLRGLWADGTTRLESTIWVADSGSDKLFAYGLGTGSSHGAKQRRAAKDIDTLGAAGNTDPQGLWSDGATMWVVDSADEMIYAYDLQSGQRLPGFDVASTVLRAAGNTAPRGMWSDGEDLWVVDATDSRVYFHEIPNANVLSSLALSGIDFGEFHSGVSSYSIPVPNTVASTTVTAVAADSSHTVRITPADANTTAEGHQVNLSAGLNTITVEVRDAGTVKRSYRVVIDQPPHAAISDDASLSALALTRVNFGAFYARHLYYDAEVATDLAVTTLSWTAGDTNAAVTVSPDDSDSGTDGHQVSIPAGGSAEVTLTVVSSDRTAQQTYTVTVHRPSTQPFGYIRSGRFGFSRQLPGIRPSGLWSDGDTMWIGSHEPVCDNADQRITAFRIGTGAYQPGRDITAFIHRCRIEGLWSDGEVLYVAERSEKLMAYDLETGSVRWDRIVNTQYAPPVLWPRGVWSDGKTFWTTIHWNDWDNHIDLVAFYRSSSPRSYHPRSSEFPLSQTRVTGTPRGLWSDGYTMWVGDWSQKKLFAYDMTTGSRRESMDFDTLNAAGMQEPSGMWSDGRRMFVADSVGRKVYEFWMPALPVLRSLYLSGLDIGLFRVSKYDYTAFAPRTVSLTTVKASAAASRSDVTITPADSDTSARRHQIALSVGENKIAVTVTEGTESRTYTVTVMVADTDTLSDDAALSALSVSGANFGPFDAATRSYSAVVAQSVSRVTVSATARGEGAWVTLPGDDADTGTDGHQVDLASGVNLIKVSVLSSDGATSATYTVTVTRQS